MSVSAMSPMRAACTGDASTSRTRNVKDRRSPRVNADMGKWAYGHLSAFTRVNLRFKSSSIPSLTHGLGHFGENRQSSTVGFLQEFVSEHLFRRTKGHDAHVQEKEHVEVIACGRQIVMDNH